MPIIDYATTLNVPEICRRSDIVDEILFNNKKNALLYSHYVDRMEFTHTFQIDDCSIVVDNTLFSYHSIDETWLRTPLSPDKKLYIPTFGGMSWLPLTILNHWKLLDKNEDAPAYDYKNDDDYPYAEVQFEDEKTFAELCCNAHKYAFDFTKGCFVSVKNPDWNMIKASLRTHLLQISGGTEDRLADYGRLILFLLSKVQLTDDEKQHFSKLTEFMPEVSQLRSVIERETLIQKFVTETKNDPHAFFTWNNDWTKFWWEK